MSPHHTAPTLLQPHLRRAAVLASLALLVGCASGIPEARPYHAFELGVSKDAGTIRHLRWHYGDLSPGEVGQVVGTGIPFVLRRQNMPVPAFFEASWQSADDSWHRVKLPVQGQIQRSVKGHSVLFMIANEQVRGEFVTYTARGDVNERFASAAPATVTEAEALAVGPARP